MLQVLGPKEVFHLTSIKPAKWANSNSPNSVPYVHPVVPYDIIISDIGNLKCTQCMCST